jgi:hypothetical protein
LRHWLGWGNNNGLFWHSTPCVKCSYNKYRPQSLARNIEKFKEAA